MMNKLFFILLCLMQIVGIFAQNKNAYEEQIQKTNLLFPNYTQLAIAIIDKDEIKFIGSIKQNNEIHFIENQSSVFEIGSITKVFTSTVLANFVHQEELKLDASIHSILSLNTSAPWTFSLKQLSNHTSGLPRLPKNFQQTKTDIRNPYKNYDESYLLDYLNNEQELYQPAGEKYEYSNLGAGLLGYALGKYKKTSIEILIQRYILKKYKMKETFVNRADIKKNTLVKGLNQFGLETPYWDFNVLFGAGGLLSTVSDLSKFVQAHFNNVNIELALTRKETHIISPKVKIALGWHILLQENNSEWYWHNGGTGGFTSSILMDVEQKKGVVVLANIGAGHEKSTEIDRLAISFLKMLNNE